MQGSGSALPSRSDHANEANVSNNTEPRRSRHAKLGERHKHPGTSPPAVARGDSILFPEHHRVTGVGAGKKRGVYVPRGGGDARPASA